MKGTAGAFGALHIDHRFLNHNDWSQLSAPIGIRHFGEVPM